MAIKGKKKSQSRGSQGVRRPAAAPRPVPGRATKPPWYKTTAGQTIAAISALILIIVILAAVNSSRQEAQELEQTQDSVENYTNQVRGLLQTITEPASEMSGVATPPPASLADDAKAWEEAFTSATTETATFLPAEGTESANALFTQSLGLFRQAASTYGIAATLEGEDQNKLLGAALAQVTSAGSVWEAAVDLLDEARDEAELSPSGLRPPASAPPSGVPTPEAPSATIPVEPEGDNGADAGGGGGGGNGGGGKKDNDAND